MPFLPFFSNSFRNKVKCIMLKGFNILLFITAYLFGKALLSDESHTISSLHRDFERGETLHFTTDNLRKNSSTINIVNKTIHPGKVFKISFEPSTFGKSSEKYRNFSYRPSLRGLPDLPKWIKYLENARKGTGFIFGVVPKNQESLELDVVALNKVNYDVSRIVLVLNISKNPLVDVPKNAVKLKIDNFDLEGIFAGNLIPSLKKLFKERLWKDASKDLHLNFISSSIDLGFRKPMRPSLKDGIVVHLASKAKVSKALIDLDRETEVLRDFPSCPRNFKRTSVEWLFSEKGFALDWCAFRLIPFKEKDAPKEVQDVKEIMKANEFDFPERSPRSNRDVTIEFLLLFPVPVSMIFLFCSIACCTLLCFIDQHEGAETEFESLIESFFLVIQDCGKIFKCNQKEDNSAILATDDFSRRGSMYGRQSRASSIHRQTDTLRR